MFVFSGAQHPLPRLNAPLRVPKGIEKPNSTKAGGQLEALSLTLLAIYDMKCYVLVAAMVQQISYSEYRGSQYQSNKNDGKGQ